MLVRNYSRNRKILNIKLSTIITIFVELKVAMLSRKKHIYTIEFSKNYLRYCRYMPYNQIL